MNTLKRYSGIAAVVCAWATFVYVWRVDHYRLLDSRPLSDATLSPQAHWYAAGLIASALLFIPFLSYLRERYGVTSRYAAVLVVGIVTTIVVALVRDQNANGSPQLAHWIAGGILAAALISLLKLFTYSIRLPKEVKRWSNRFFWVLIAVLFPETLLLTTHHGYALCELINLAISDAWVVYVSLVPYRAHQ